jgi:prepilin-type N-terminal cleavage/methylation domain-containing protein
MEQDVVFKGSTVKQQYNLRSLQARKKHGQRGFTLLELAVASLILMVGVVGVVQLVPASQQSNLNNRVDTTAMVFAQREMDQIMQQPLTLTTFNDSDGRAISLGSITATDTIFGGPVIVNGTTASINFTVPSVGGYNYTFSDPNDPAGATYRMRWAVISKVSAGVVVGKRFIVGCRRVSNTNSMILSPAVVDTMVQK